MPDPSTIEILVGGSDVTRYCVFSQTRFDSVASSISGTGRIVLKDPLRELNFTTGDEVLVTLDGVRLWGGIVMSKGMTNFFPAVDTTDVDTVNTRQWVLDCSDFNVWMSKRVIRNPNDYLNQIAAGPAPLGRVLKTHIPLYMDVPPGFDYTTYVQDTNIPYASAEGGSTFLMQQGSYWRDQLDLMARQGPFNWRVDANKALHFETLQDLVSPWGFTDHSPDGVRRIGFREGTVREDGTNMITDGLVWGGSVNAIAPVDEQQIFFARYPDPPANDQHIHIEWGEGDDKVIFDQTFTAEQETEAIRRQELYGRWQRAEIGVSEALTSTALGVNVRAFMMVEGDTGTNEILGVDSGLNRPVWQISLAWFANDVPGKIHLVPGMIVPMSFFTLGEHGTALGISLPLRSVSISFPTLPSELPDDEPQTYVRFDGEFGISYSDTRFLWRFLDKQRQSSASSGSTGSGGTAPVTVAPGSTTTVTGALAGDYPVQSPDGLRTVFNLPHTYISGTVEVYLNGLLQRPRFEYIESSPSHGAITFAVAPFSDDTIWVIYRTGAT